MRVVCDLGNPEPGLNFLTATEAARRGGTGSESLTFIWAVSYRKGRTTIQANYDKNNFNRLLS